MECVAYLSGSRPMLRIPPATSREYSRVVKRRSGSCDLETSIAWASNQKCVRVVLPDASPPLARTEQANLSSGFWRGRPRNRCGLCPRPAVRQGRNHETDEWATGQDPHDVASARHACHQDWDVIPDAHHSRDLPRIAHARAGMTNEPSRCTSDILPRSTRASAAKVCVSSVAAKAELGVEPARNGCQ
jgi:hypothetical protein